MTSLAQALRLHPGAYATRSSGGEAKGKGSTRPPAFFGVRPRSKTREKLPLLGVSSQAWAHRPWRAALRAVCGQVVGRRV